MTENAFVPTRAAGLERMAGFFPDMGARYSQSRNFDHGPGARANVSQLSPYVRRRLVTEQELVVAALAEHGLEGAEKFIQEVVWRTYFKGWLERRPTVWRAYVDGLASDLAMLAEDGRLQARYDAAVDGRTGLDCFDAWACELQETGYLHNHARMWFASIWVYTLGLPWRLGADFFYRNLLDGDPASNTLGWRWVVGLHTRGKTYRADAWNIARFTDGRFAPKENQLAADAPALTDEEPDGLPPVSAVPPADAPLPDVPTALLITEEDCSPEAFGLDALDIRGVATMAATGLRSRVQANRLVHDFEAGALTDAADRLGRGATPLDPNVESLIAWVRDLGARQIVTPYVPVGPLRDWLDAARPRLAAASVPAVTPRRPWDDAFWPYATAGFFKVKQKIPAALASLGLG